MIEQPPPTQNTILVLDDDAGVLTLERKALERAGYRVVSATTREGAEALLKSSACGASPAVDLIVLDYSLSGTESGLEFFRELAKRGTAPPSILATGFSDEGRILEALRAGVRDVIRKSEDFLETLPRTVTRVLREVETERKVLEAEAASRAKDHFLAVLSHELRTPLTPILTVAQERERDMSLPEDAREAFSMIRRNVLLEARLIDDLLDLTKISRGKLELHVEHVDLHQKILEVVRMCESEAMGKGLRVRVELRAKRHNVQADPARLPQVLWNLVRNAIKFTPTGGVVTIQTEDVAPPSDAPGVGEFVRVSVSDNGIGISADALPIIFGAFEQGDRFITRNFGGLGLGLAITRALVTLHGGTIEAASEGIGRGSTFTFTVRPTVASADDTEVVAGQLPTNESRTKVSILLVEDHPDTSRALSRLLRTIGYEVRTADSVAAGVQAADSRSFDLLISDIGLPDGSGLDLMRQIRARKPMRGIVLSGFGMEEDVNRSLEAGFVAHLTKPVNFAQLESTISRVVGEPVTA